MSGVNWHSGPVFLVYGAMGMLTFIPSYLSDGRLGLKFEYGQSSVVGVFCAWIFGIVFVAIICNLAGQSAHRVYHEDHKLE